MGDSPTWMWLLMGGALKRENCIRRSLICVIAFT